MHRLIAVLVLLGGGFQTAAPHCPMALAPAGVATAAEQHHGGQGAHSHHASDATSAPEAASDSSSPHDPESGCGLAMACGTVVILTTAPLATTSPRTMAGPVELVPGLCSTAFPTHEPPPPRLPV